MGALPLHLWRKVAPYGPVVNRRARRSGERAAVDPAVEAGAYAAESAQGRTPVTGDAALESRAVTLANRLLGLLQRLLNRLLNRLRNRLVDL
jgi:hypothetical protein